jgi:hypothetical protein
MEQRPRKSFAIASNLLTPSIKATDLGIFAQVIAAIA